MNKNPFRSRSTVILLAALAVLCFIVGAVLKSGFWDGSFGGLCILVLRELIAQSFGHQLQADTNKTTNESAPAPPAS